MKYANGQILNETILDNLNEGKPERYHISPVTLGRILSSLGFQRTNNGQARGIIWDESLMSRLCGRYGIQYDFHFWRLDCFKLHTRHEPSKHRGLCPASVSAS